MNPIPAKGYLALVLHCHLPFVRHPEHEDSFEESWLYQAITEVYVPLLLMLDGLVEDRIDFRLTLTLTPTLVSMLQDPLLQSRYLGKIERLIELAEREATRTGLQPEFRSLAGMYHERFIRIRDAFVDRYKRDLVERFRQLQGTDRIEILASAATHGYLPLLSVQSWAVRSQIHVGLANYVKTFGRKANGFWLPECGYYPGVDQWLADEGMRFTILETHGVTRAKPRPRYGVHAPLLSPAGLAAFGRDPDSSRQVWSAAEGYPGDHDYREFYRDIAHDLDVDTLERFVHRGGLPIDTGIKYFRITGKTESKQVYIPSEAENKTEIHAEHFLQSRSRKIESLAAIMDRKPILVAPYDAELFGHWWYEGPIWLNHVIRKAASQSYSVRLITLSEYLAKHPDLQPASPPLSSWGRNGFNEVWLGLDNQWIYPHLHRAAGVMETLESENTSAEGMSRRAFDQAKRELLLAESSDWAFMMDANTTVRYAVTRTRTHLENFTRLAEQIARHQIDEPWLRSLESRDCIFSSEELRSDRAGRP